MVPGMFLRFLDSIVGVDTRNDPWLDAGGELAASRRREIWELRMFGFIFWGTGFLFSSTVFVFLGLKWFGVI